MMRRAFRTAAVVLLATSPTHALIVSDFVGSHMVTPGVPAFGVNLDGVVKLAWDDIPLASGALITDRHVLTVAHAIDQDEDGLVDDSVTEELQVVFELPGGSETFRVESAALPEQWSDSPPDEAVTHDIAVLKLVEDAPPAAPRYPLYGGDDEVGQRVVITGYGVTGHGSVGMDVQNFELMGGLNRYEVDMAEFFFDLFDANMLLYDFDSGLPANNALELEGIPSDLGFGDDEVGAAMGDSGGPVFIGTAIAGVSSLGFGGPPADVTSDTDSSWGELFLDTRVSFYRDFLTTATNGQAVFFDPSGLPGDYNNSGAVDQGDLDLVLLKWGETWPPEVTSWVNDQPTDGKIDQDDLDRVLLNWGDVASTASVAVPEPNWAAVCSLLCGLAVAIQERQKREHPVRYHELTVGAHEVSVRSVPWEQA